MWMISNNDFQPKNFVSRSCWPFVSWHKDHSLKWEPPVALWHPCSMPRVLMLESRRPAGKPATASATSSLSLCPLMPVISLAVSQGMAELLQQSSPGWALLTGSRQRMLLFLFLLCSLLTAHTGISKVVLFFFFLNSSNHNVTKVNTK